MIRALIFAFLLSCSVEAGESPRVSPDIEPTTHSIVLDLEVYVGCKRYSEAVYADMLQGLTMTHPEAEGKEKTALEFMKDAFIDCFKPYKET